MRPSQIEFKSGIPLMEDEQVNPKFRAAQIYLMEVTKDMSEEDYISYLNSFKRVGFNKDREDEMKEFIFNKTPFLMKHIHELAPFVSHLIDKLLIGNNLSKIVDADSSSL